MAAEAFTPFTFESTGHRYDVMRVLMEHPFAPTQWVARRTEKDSEVARVVLLRQVAGDTVGERVTRASQEAAALRAWGHTKIAPVLGVAQHEGAVFVVTEHDAGMLLASVLQASALTGQRLTPGFAAFVALEVVEALAFVHQARWEPSRPPGVLHRAVSPLGVRLHARGRVTLGDFSAAVPTGGARTRTPSGRLRGAVAYAAPELLLSALGRKGRQGAAGALPEVDARADVFSLGMVLLEMLLGHHPLEAPGRRGADTEVGLQEAVGSELSSWLTVDGLAARLMRFRSEEVGKRDASIPLQLRRIAAKAARVDVARRYATADALREELHLWLLTHGQGYGAAEAARECESLRRAVAAVKQPAVWLTLERGVFPAPKGLE